MSEEKVTKNVNVKNKNISQEVKFSKLYYHIFMPLCCIARKILHGKNKNSAAFDAQLDKGPVLAIANHLSAFDLVYFAPPFKGHKINFVVAENMMYSMPIFAKLIKGYHAITKKQFYSDFQCIKKIKRYLDAGISVLMCPEGKIAADGCTGVISDSTARLVQWLGYPVATVKLSGAGLIRPKWAKNIRRGPAQTECDMLLSAEDVKTMTKAQIMDEIRTALAHNEHKYQIEHGIEYKAKRYAHGLEKLLYRCPKCGAEFEMTAIEDELHCGACGNAVRYCHTGELVPISADSVCPERIDLWYEQQKEHVRQEILSDDFRMEETVNLFVENAANNGYKFIATGTLTLDKENLRFDTEQKMRPNSVEYKYKVNAMDYDVSGSNAELEPVEEDYKHLKTPIKNTDTVANIPGSAVDIYDDKHTYRMMFPMRQASTKYALAIELLYEQRNKTAVKAAE